MDAASQDAPITPRMREASLKAFACRDRLILFFGSRGCSDAANLADETIFRVVRKIALGEVVVNMEAYAYRVARYVLSEHLRNPLNTRTEPIEGVGGKRQIAPPRAAPSPERDACMNRCVKNLSREHQYLIQAYYGEGKNEENRKKLANELKISIGALMIRASRIRKRLRKCIDDCLEEYAGR